MLWFIRALYRDADIIGLFFCQRGEFYTNLSEMESCNLLVQLFRKTVDTGFVLFCPELKLCNSLVCERVAHDERWVTGGTSEVDQATFCKQVDRTSIFEGVFVDLWFDVGS